MTTALTRISAVERTPRFIQTRDKFSIESNGTSTATWDIDVALPEAWSVGLIVGESGAGKTTLARHLLDAGGLGGLLVTPRDADGNLIEPFAWPANQCVVDGFPEAMGINDVVGLMSSVGFSSPPAWLRPFGTLSIGEQFRATTARAMADAIDQGRAAGGRPPVVLIDEFANAVDRTVAQVGSSAVAKTVRRLGLQFIAITTREDVAEWLEPDWVIPMAKGEPVRMMPAAARGSLRRPDLRLAIGRSGPEAWTRFRAHHYLDHALNKSARCFVGRIDNEPACFTAVIHWPTTRGLVYREHRTVCLPHFQGVGLGNVMSDAIASAYVTTERYFSRTSHPALMHARARSPLWRMDKPPQISSPRSSGGSTGGRDSSDRVGATFEFVGPPNVELARRLGLKLPAV